MNRFLLGLTLVLLVAVAAAPATASYAVLVAAPESDMYSDIIYDTGGLVTVNIWALGLTAPTLHFVEFALDIPPCDGLTLVDVSYGSNLYLGDIETGVTVAFVGCKVLPYLVATLTFQSTGINECCYLHFIPPSGLGQMQAFDCSSNAVSLDGAPSAIAPAGSGGACAAPTVPADPSPADGAVDQSIMPALSWESHSPLPTLCIQWFNVYLGTDPNPALAAQDVWPPYTVGPLQANTTYYWWVRTGIGSCIPHTDGPVWSFTTGAPVAVETSTWGAIKALYQAP